jgi:hypothetical protein
MSWRRVCSYRPSKSLSVMVRVSWSELPAIGVGGLDVEADDQQLPEKGRFVYDALYACASARSPPGVSGASATGAAACCSVTGARGRS